MKRITAKICSLALALALALCCLPAAYAAENEITVSFSFYDGAVVIPKSDLTVYDGIAEEYGYSLRGAEGITVFDAVVAAHKAYYGDEFTSQTANNYLVMSSGFITKAFANSSASLGFFVNDKMPNDGIFNEAYNSYTGYACDQAIIAGNDYISFFTYKSSYWADYYITTAKNEITAAAGEEFTVSATGYSAMWYGCYRDEDRAEYTYPMQGLDVYSTVDFITYTKIGTLDKNGETVLSFDELGTVYLCIMGNFDDPSMGKCPAVANWVKVNIVEPEGAIYLPESVDISVDTESDKNAVIIHYSIGYFDITGKGPTKAECFTINITFAPLAALIRFLSNLI